MCIDSKESPLSLINAHSLTESAGSEKFENRLLGPTNFFAVPAQWLTSAPYFAFELRAPLTCDKGQLYDFTTHDACSGSLGTR